MINRTYYINLNYFSTLESCNIRSYIFNKLVIFEKLSIGSSYGAPSSSYGAPYGDSYSAPAYQAPRDNGFIYYNDFPKGLVHKLRDNFKWIRWRVLI